ncbi:MULTISPECIES: aldo/keto reductase [unclassified Campylobacter]|uniref:aldo/keto reductase n=1 Tax=unclassified Campylobacter TaxID=2593542 RepID=UPI001EE4AB81|nr:MULTISPECIES: aldo/keto reductase [unclassified Campylobacter]
MQRRAFLERGLKAGLALSMLNASLALANDKKANSQARIKNPSKSLPKRILGGKIEVSALGLGCMGMSHGHGPARDIKEMTKLIRQAYDLGVTFFDTAEIYGPHTNEELVGPALKPIRDKVVIGTKFGLYYPFGKQMQDSSKKSIIRAIDASLKRLQTDYIDIYTQHRVDTDTPIEEVADTMQELVKQGKIRAWGLSEAGAKTIERAHKVFAPVSVQSQYSISFREHEEDGVIPTCKRLGIGFVAYSPLDRGLLTGLMNENYRFAAGDMRLAFPRYTPQALKANQAIVNFVASIGKQKGATITQTALAWLLAQDDFIVPIPETTNPKHLIENLKAVEFSFTQDELAKIDEEVKKIVIVGERFAPGSDAAKSVGL